MTLNWALFLLPYSKHCFFCHIPTPLNLPMTRGTQIILFSGVFGLSPHEPPRSLRGIYLSSAWVMTCLKYLPIVSHYIPFFHIISYSCGKPNATNDYHLGMVYTCQNQKMILRDDLSLGLPHYYPIFIVCQYMQTIYSLMIIQKY